ncbi:aromatase/cyclase [Streptomyces sp. NPDC089919]|uniref:aromatase/cyclase n=1 Tax=Streptomyces sp. NPDC089919 TaxID=3155188 RepID=UPI00341F0B8A
MSDAQVHRTVHDVIAAAPAGVLYGMIADATQWPLFFPPVVHVEQLDFDGTRERLRMWATTGDQVKSWVSRRRLDVERLRVEFTQELTAAPVTSMSGVWTVEPMGNRSRVTLEHAFTVDGDDPGAVRWMEEVTRANSRAQLDRLAAPWANLDETVMSFEDSVRIKGPAELIFDFLYRAADWPGHLPHVKELALAEEEPGVQVLSMGSISIDGSSQNTESVRICFPAAGRIVYKQTLTSPLLAAHTGEWAVDPDESGVTVTARHMVLLREDAVEEVLGEGADLATARRHIRDALGQAGLSVLRHATQYAAGAVRVL